MKKKRRHFLNNWVFWPPFLVMVLCIALSFLNQDAFATAMNQGYLWVSHWLDWLYLLVGLAFVAVAAFILFSKAGSIKFGGKDAKPKFTTFQWFAMSLCGGIAIGIVFWGVAEPIQFLAEPNNGIEPFSSEAVLFSMSQVYFHWSFTPYALYTLATIPIAWQYTITIKKCPLVRDSISSLATNATAPSAKQRMLFSLFALLGGMASGMGLGLMQIASGLEFSTGLEPSRLVWALIAVFIVVTFTFSSKLGLDKGLKWLADQNLKNLYYCSRLYFFIVVSHSLYSKNRHRKHGYSGYDVLPKVYLSGSGQWRRLGPAGGQSFIGHGIVYAPVIGIFLTRLCYGRTVRQFLLVNLVAPAIFGIIWFTIFWRYCHSYAAGKYLRSLVCLPG